MLYGEEEGGRGVVGGVGLGEGVVIEERGQQGVGVRVGVGEGERVQVGVGVGVGVGAGEDPELELHLRDHVQVPVEAGSLPDITLAITREV